MRVTITGTVKDRCSLNYTVTITHREILALIKKKAKEKGIWDDKDLMLQSSKEEIISVVVED